MKQRGFTVIELLVAIVFVLAAATIFMIQKNDLETTHRDKLRKTAINAMYYSLTEVYYKQHKFYPQTIDAKQLPSVESSLFTDPSNKKIGEQGGEYRYEPSNCRDGKCQGFMLRADLEKEQDYVKTN